MRDQKRDCEHIDARQCALNHITKARQLLTESRYEEAGMMLEHAEVHLKEIKQSGNPGWYRGGNP